MMNIKHKKNYGLFLGVVFLLSGCISRSIILDRAIVRNATGHEIREVAVRHEPTKITGYVSSILPGRSFDLGFSAQPLLSDQAVVSWKTGPSRAHMKKLILPYKGHADKDARTLVYTIQRSGDVTVKLER